MHVNIFEKNNCVNHLGQVLNERMGKAMEGPLELDFGEIDNQYRLTTNQFQQPIPKGDYSVCRHLCGGPGNNFNWNTQNTTCHVTHRHLTYPPKLKPGDRVLVAWVQNEACVIDVIWSSNRL